MKRAVYPGTFDPITFGHLDIIERSAKVVDELVIGILADSRKKNPLFTIEERLHMLQESTKQFSNILIQVFDGMTVDFAKKNNANLIIRGLRAVTDFESELQISQANQQLDSSIDTMFFTTSLEYAFLSSSIVKEMASYGTDISLFVPKPVVGMFRQKFPDLISAERLNETSLL
ncbi:MAG: pantetheine-phosphate adenylyltransferase [Clostridiales bacterium]|nr:pantetheine-phosphate adenylyltransferase [Clostridiales bacterium]